MQAKLHLVPETDSAILPRGTLTKEEGRNPKNWTRHVYDHSELCETSSGSMIVHLFRCTETKQLRVWGCE